MFDTLNVEVLDRTDCVGPGKYWQCIIERVDGSWGGNVQVRA